MNRREFTIEAALAVLGGAMITVGGCDNATEPTPVYVDVSGDVASNHGHAVMIAAAQFQQAQALELDIQGEAGHTHMVSLSANELSSIGAGGRVEKESSGTRHTHVVTFQG